MSLQQKLGRLAEPAVSLRSSPAPLEITLEHQADFAGWRAAARRLWAAGVPPEAVRWRVDGAQPSLFEASLDPAVAAAPRAVCNVPRRFLELAEKVALHADPGRFALLYRLLVRIGRGERQLLSRSGDPDVERAEAMAAAVRRSAAKMKALLRFKEVTTGEGRCFVGWFEPEHYVLERVAAFFADRFGTMRWAIATPYRSVRWDGERLRFGPGGRRGEVPAEDAPEAAWRAFHAGIWQAAPASGEPAREGKGVPLPERPVPADRPEPSTLAEAREAAAACRACPLWARATRTVFGEGPRDAAVMLVGEQPGDRADREGRPFVGPASRVLDRALADAGLDRSVLYLTDAVKHFKHVRRSQRRIRQTPERREIEACRHWLELERRLVQPRLIVALGVVAAEALLRRPVSLQLERGRMMELPDGGGHALVTEHPSAILRIPDAAAQAREYRRLVGDLLLAVPYLRRAA
ncbi:UdgX family uracil-DNA binding protein [Benzoatithermus flavus]|uniref:Type-4 uracil-DNA glycosylase n=1 Tax=Benzoatithermus flavus TaxID=3108223 RepID=A0ABU8XMF6_9PROT